MLEFILVGVIVIIQLSVFIRTVIKITQFRKIIPYKHSPQGKPSYTIKRVEIPISDLEKQSPNEILENINQNNYSSPHSIFNPTDNLHYENLEAGEDYEIVEEIIEDNSSENPENLIVSVIMSNGTTNEDFQEILNSINSYLIRNSGAASDFNLIKDILERHSNAVEEDINSSVGIPLYLGLMGTMIGIVIGLFFMPELSLTAGSATFGQGISVLIGGVKIAMIASFTGLLLTIVNSGWVFKGSKTLLEMKKNKFYTFIQIELLPIINQGMASTLGSLQRNLISFNNDFSVNLRQLQGLFNSNIKVIQQHKALFEKVEKAKVFETVIHNLEVLKELNTSINKFSEFNKQFAENLQKFDDIFISNKKTILIHKEFLGAIEKAKVYEMAVYNANVLEKLDISIEHLKIFNGYLENVSSFVENSRQIVVRTQDFIQKTDKINTIADSLENKLNQGQQLLDFLSAHFQKLEDHKQLTSDAVADVGHSISDIFKELKTQIQKSSDLVKDFTVDEIEILRTIFSQSRTNLENLEYLESLNKDFSEFKNGNKQQLENLNYNISKSIQILEQIESHNSSSVANYIKGLFKKKTK